MLNSFSNDNVDFRNLTAAWQSAGYTVSSFTPSQLVITTNGEHTPEDVFQTLKEGLRKYSSLPFQGTISIDGESFAYPGYAQAGT